jgi:hypothetical protein
MWRREKERFVFPFAWLYFAYLLFFPGSNHRRDITDQSDKYCCARTGREEGEYSICS